MVSVFLFAAGLSAVAPARAQTLPRGEIVPRVVCAADTEQSYALYLPSVHSESKPLPILYLYDPRKRGPLAAERFREAAERLGWILASSNNTMSDGPMNPNIVAIKAMWADTHERFAIDSRRVYAGGFSGGARAACLLANKVDGEVAGVIAVGGGFPDGEPPKKGMRFAFFGAVGNTDFNYGEMRRLDRTLAALGAPHRLAVYDGPHSWCPAAVCGRGVEWLELQAMRTGARERDPALAGRLLEQRLEEAAALETAGRPTEAFQRLTEAAEDFRGLADTKAAEAAAGRLGESREIRDAITGQERLEEAERRRADRLRESLAAFLRAEPPPPLQAAVNDLQIKKLRRDATQGESEADRLSASRVLEELFVQTAFYLPRDLSSKGQPARAELVAGIAAELKPDRAAGVWYDLACFRALAGDRRGAFVSLRRAVEKGFRDRAAIEEDPDLASLRSEQAYRAILARISP